MPSAIAAAFARRLVAATRERAAAPASPAEPAGEERQGEVSYEDFETEMQALAERQGARFEVYGTTDSDHDPLTDAYALTALHADAGAGAPLVVITAGCHGEEQAGPLAFYHRGDEVFEYARDAGVSLRVYPCLNPEGFDGHQRHDAAGDLENTFFEYEIAPGRWAGELPPGTRPLGRRLYVGMDDDVAALYADLERLPVPAAALDIHQDGDIPTGTAYCYAFGERAPYARIMRACGARPFARKPIDNSSWTDVPVRLQTDRDGLLTFFDGSVSDYFYRRRVQLSACLETALASPLPEAIDQTVAWCRGAIDYAAARR